MALRPAQLDERCRELAAHALADEPRLKDRADELARELADNVETWIACKRVEASLAERRG